ncbi:MAG: hypothetical protein OEY11_09135 [Gammaproteobacteria bacterium]|nr:hypothetical protein [Gammaproteobacteria bacterium]
MLKIYQVIFLILFFNSVALADTSSQLKLMTMYHSIKNKQVDLLEEQMLHIKSDVSKTRMQADVYAIKTYDFKTLTDKLRVPSRWCDFITLHLNIKACTYQLKPDQALSFFAGRKFYEAADDAYELRYQFKVDHADEKFLKLQLAAAEGPFGTQDYLIVLESLKIGHEVVLHLSLSYQTSFSSRLGTSVYLSTIGADKVGFSKITANDGGGQYIGGIEGIIERNVMRYFLALATYLNHDSATLGMPRHWFLSTEKYARQLHEVALQDYLAAKKQEYKQQRSMQKNINARAALKTALEADQ